MPRLETDRITDPLWLERTLAEEISAHLHSVRFCYLVKVKTPTGNVSHIAPSRTEAQLGAQELGKILQVGHIQDGSNLGKPFRGKDGHLYQKVHTCDPKNAVNGRNGKKDKLLYRLLQVE